MRKKTIHRHGIRPLWIALVLAIVSASAGAAGPNERALDQPPADVAEVGRRAVDALQDGKRGEDLAEVVLGGLPVPPELTAAGADGPALGLENALAHVSAVEDAIRAAEVLEVILATDPGQERGGALGGAAPGLADPAAAGPDGAVRGVENALAHVLASENAVHAAEVLELILATDPGRARGEALGGGDADGDDLAPPPVVGGLDGGSTGSAGFAIIPEPATIGLVGLGALLLARRTRRGR